MFKARLVEFDPPDYRGSAEALVNEQLKIELLKHAPPAKPAKKQGSAEAGREEIHRGEATCSDSADRLKNGAMLSPVAARPSPTGKP